LQGAFHSFPVKELARVKELDITEREREGVTILEVKGEVDIYSGEALKEKLEEMSEKPCLLLNIAGIDYIDSYGLSLLISIRKKMGKLGRQIALCSPQSYVKRILNLTRLYDFLAVYDYEDEAIEAILKGDGQFILESEPKVTIQSDERRV
jgi:anti-sigma B factor antagonist